MNVTRVSVEVSPTGTVTVVVWLARFALTERLGGATAMRLVEKGKRAASVTVTCPAGTMTAGLHWPTLTVWSEVNPVAVIVKPKSPLTN